MLSAQELRSRRRMQYSPNVPFRPMFRLVSCRTLSHQEDSGFVCQLLAVDIRIIHNIGRVEGTQDNGGYVWYTEIQISSFPNTEH